MVSKMFFTLLLRPFLVKFRAPVAAIACFCLLNAAVAGQSKRGPEKGLAQPEVVFSNPAPITINDRTSSIGTASPYSSNITAAGLGNITSMSVVVSNFNHTFPDDVDILLVGPGGQKFILMSDVGGGLAANNVTLTFADGGTAMGDATQLISGTVRPTNIGATDTFPAPAPGTPYNNPPTAGAATFASVFNGAPANGTWSLYVGDDAGGDVGIISDGWTINLNTDAGSASFSNTNPIRINDSYGRASLYGSPITVTGLTGKVTDVNVTLTNMNHTFPQDIGAELVGPGGQRITLMSQSVGDDLTPLANTTLTFDDSAATLLPTSGGVASGSFRPAAYAIVDFPAPSPVFPSNYPTLGGTATLASAFNGTDPNGVWTLYVVDVAPPDPGNINGGWSIDITAGGTAKKVTKCDYDGDGRTDVSTWTPNTGTWMIRDSSTLKYRTIPGFGTWGDLIAPSDYDGDGKTDIAYYHRTDSTFHILQSSTGTPVIRTVGSTNTMPVPGDYDGDGLSDAAVFNQTTHDWTILRTTTGTNLVVNFGASTDRPVPGDYDGDGRYDIALYSPPTSNWRILTSGSGFVTEVDLTLGAFPGGDRLVQGDYDGDLKTDIAAWRRSDGTWAVRSSATGVVTNTVWGVDDFSPQPGDFDGDGKSDLAVWDPYGLNPTPPGGQTVPPAAGPAANWSILQSAISGISPANRYDTLGTANEIATPGFLPYSDTATAASVSVSGRVVTNTGQGLRNALVTLTGPSGVSRTVNTNAFGYYRFDDIEVGQTFIASVSSKRYRFDARTLSVTSEIGDVDFVGETPD